MARGRYQQGRYQQGIGIPQTLGVQPTTWTEPKEPQINRMTWTPPNAGVSRKYGSTPAYVDTVPHRWTYGDESKKSWIRKKKKEDDSSTSTTPFSVPPTGPPATGAGVPPSPPTYPSPTSGTGTAVPPPPTLRKVPKTPTTFSLPPVPNSGMVVPPPPPSSGKSIKVGPFGVPPMGDEGADFFTASAREASDEPFKPGVDWKDEPDNPFPKGGRKDFDTSRMFDPTYKPAQERTTKSAGSRTQKRKPKTT